MLLISSVTPGCLAVSCIHHLQPITSVQRRRGSVGPQPQILTLAHDSPRYSYVPGLPSHPYQQHHQPQPTTSQQPYVVQQPGPIGRSSSDRQPVSPVDEEPPISQYDIINEADPIRRQKKRSELANALNRDWSEQASCTFFRKEGCLCCLLAGQQNIRGSLRVRSLVCSLCRYVRRRLCWKILQGRRPNGLTCPHASPTISGRWTP